jgi:hypothetical protein
MKRQNLVVVGGGSTYTLGMIMSLIEEKENFPLKSITFYDTNAERQEKIAKATEVILREKYPELEYFHYTTDKQEAYTNADFAFVQIRTGGLQMREKDEQIPLKYEAVGQETCGPGGIAEVSPPPVYVGLATVIGVIGSFMTSSNTSSNVLFSPLHGSVVQSMDGLSLPHVIAAQSAGGAIGNAISPANVILGTSTAGLKGKDSEVFKPTLVFSVISGVLVAAAAILLHFIG